MAEKHDHAFSRARLESLTDGLFATVMTILVLSLIVPIVTGTNLSQQLTSSIFALLPNVLVYVASFAVLLVMWIGHNNLFRHVHEVHPRLLWLNGLLLLLVGLVPFSTAFLGRYPLEQPTILVYGVNFLLLAITFRLLTYYICKHHKGVANSLRRTARNGIVPLVIYILAMVFSFFSPYISIGLFVFMPIYYLGQAFFGMYRLPD
jgi:uncharacterized membrane protein